MECINHRCKSILFVLPGTVLGGAEQVLKMVAIHYAELGYCVTILIIKTESLDGWKSLANKVNIKINYLNTGNSGIYGLIKLIGNLIVSRNSSYEYVFSSHVHMNALVGILRKMGLLKTKFVVGRESTSTFLSFSGVKLLLIKCLYYLGYKEIDLLICQTELMKDQLLENLHFLKESGKVVVIPNPIDLKFIKKKSIESIDLGKISKYLVAAGRLIHTKGFDVLIKAFAQVIEKQPELNLVILGEGPDRLKLTALIKECGLGGKVHLIGHVENVIPYFKMAEACIVSSRLEGFPNVLLQMMSQNVRIVSTLCCGGITSIPYINTAKTDNIGSLQEAIHLSLGSDSINVRSAFDQFLMEREIGAFVNSINTSLEV